MFRGVKSRLAVLRLALVAAALSLLAAPVHAQNENRGFSFHADTPCHAILSPEETIAQIAADRERWSCETLERLPADAQQIALRFDLGSSAMERPGVLVNSHTYRETDTFTRFAVHSVGDAQTSGSGWLTLDQFAPTSPVWKTRIEAPDIGGDIRAVIVRIDAPARTGVLTRFDLVDAGASAPVANGHQVIAALLCGLLLAPAFIGLGHFRALRTRYAIYHVVYCLLAVVQVAALGGLLPLLFDISRTTQFIVLHLSFDLVAAVSALFAAAFLEPDKLNRFSRRLLHAIAALALALGVMRVTLGMSIGVAVAPFYYAGYAVFLIGLAAALVHPVRQKSRAAIFLILSYLPLVLIGVTRVVLALATDFEIRFHAVLLQHFALSWQIVVSAFGVADRFLIIRRQRDHARTAAQMMERASERDTLTGVYNRRILTERFERLYAEGFTSLGLIDLDHFKAINDTYGHGVGDRVLQAVAEALEPDADTIVVRMGGEEFALLMRGDDVAARAEARRVAVAGAAQRILDTDRRVTASMGLVEQAPPSPVATTFSALYERADRLLYDAKNDGRNRTASEQLKVFRKRRRRERRAAREAA